MVISIWKGARKTRRITKDIFEKSRPVNLYNVHHLWYSVRWLKTVSNAFHDCCCGNLLWHDNDINVYTNSWTVFRWYACTAVASTNTEWLKWPLSKSKSWKELEILLWATINAYTASKFGNSPMHSYVLSIHLFNNPTLYFDWRKISKL